MGQFHHPDQDCAVYAVSAGQGPGYLAFSGSAFVRAANKLILRIKSAYRFYWHMPCIDLPQLPSNKQPERISCILYDTYLMFIGSNLEKLS